MHKLTDNVKKYGPSLVLAILLISFSAYSSFFAFNLQSGIIPDEPTHLTFSKLFSTTWGIPSDNLETITWGALISQNPFLYYWINGRIINLISLLMPSANDDLILITLRLINTFFALGTVIFCFFISKELISDRWWRLLPIFLLTNTLMFVFLAGGVSYDNLANLLSMAGIYYLIRVFRKDEFLKNSLIWMTLIGLGSLVKYTILPLALAMIITWLAYYFLYKPEALTLLHLKRTSNIILLVVLLIVIIGNIAIYGANITRYQSLTPECDDVFTEKQCELDPLVQRDKRIANDPKMTINESIAKGYPSPIKYALVDWVENMLLRSFGMIGHKAYFPLEMITLYQILFYSVSVLGIFNLLYIRRISFSSISLLFIAAFYSIILLINNYNSELTYNFQHIAFQGRYIFPVIGVIYVLSTKILKHTPIWIIRTFLLLTTIGIFFIGGPLTIIRKYLSISNIFFK